ncbi:MAG: dolichyl-phosphate-mannose-protein mannosyltransferase, partial [Actinomycetota bacterium]|nr:dolichyl-phosphate-mannose-protein mannosyltransferase [Actinomycetota bacterium]
MEPGLDDRELSTAPAPPIWSRADLIALFALWFGAFGLYLYRLSEPNISIFDEGFYVTDACRYLHAIGHGAAKITVLLQSDCLGGELTTMHPPLAKWIIAASMKLFGVTPFGWRLPSVLAGTAAVLLVYVLARLCGLSTRGATIAGAFLAIDPLHFTMSRIAMLDIF